jgi:uncharacterized protein YggU (UPF0235/DUF167 family)
MADALNLRKSGIAIGSGETSRLKVLHLPGDTDAVIARLDNCLSVVGRDGLPRV